MRNISMVLKRIMLYPLIALVTIMQYVMVFVSSIAAGLIDFLAAVAVLAAIILRIANAITDVKMVCMLLLAFFFFMTPFIGQAIVTVLEQLRGKLLAYTKASSSRNCGRDN